MKEEKLLHKPKWRHQSYSYFYTANYSGNRREQQTFFSSLISTIDTQLCGKKHKGGEAQKKSSSEKVLSTLKILKIILSSRQECAALFSLVTPHFLIGYQNRLRWYKYNWLQMKQEKITGKEEWLKKVKSLWKMCLKIKTEKKPWNKA